MKLLIGLCGYILLMLGVILALHYDMTLGVLISFSGLFMFWAMLPMHSDQNERLRRYEQQHQKWLRGRHDRF